jgi:hypothetical protein
MEVQTVGKQHESVKEVQQDMLEDRTDMVLIATGIHHYKSIAVSPSPHFDRESCEAAVKPL